MQRRHTALVLALCTAALAVSGCATPSRESVGHDAAVSRYTNAWAGPGARQYFAHLPDRQSIRVLRVGDGPALLLLHTIRTQLDYFQKVILRLSEGYTVYAIDLPGHGMSSPAPVDYDEPYFRKAVSAFIVQQDLRDLTLVGESIGGVLSLTVAAELPARVKRVVSLNPYDYGEKFGGGIRRSSSGWMVGLFSVFGEHTMEPRIVTGAVLRGGFTNPDALPSELLDEFSRSGFREGYRAVEYSVFKNWHSWLDARDIYSRVKAPVTLVNGSGDWSTLGDRRRTAAALPNVRLVTIEGAGHFTSIEKPYEVVHAVMGAAPR